MAHKKTTEDFKVEVSLKYPELVVLGEYKGAAISIEIGCQVGHTWTVSPTNLLSKGTRSTCRECYGKSTIRLDWTSANILKLRELVENNTSTEELQKIFNTTKASIDNACSKNNITRDRFLSHTKRRLLDITSSLNYTVLSIQNSSYGNIEYICDKGHSNTQTISNFMAGHYCPKCISALGISKGESELLEFIKSEYSGWIETSDRDILEGKELDIVLPDLGIAFEFNGEYWHREDKVGKNYHLNKTKDTIDFGYQLIHIYESEWATKKEIVKSRIKSILGSTSKIFARKCIVKEIRFPKDFLNTNHIQEQGSPTSVNLGLFFENNLVAVMTFSSPRFSKEYTYELVRYCSILNTTIVGGASKLLKYFKNKYMGSIISYSDKRWSIGSLYSTLGFKYSHTSVPNYRYYKRLTSLSRYKCQKHLLKTLFPNSFSEELTEKEIMSLEGYYPVYDCGNDVWVLN
jgi:hypothetical protein